MKKKVANYKTVEDCRRRQWRISELLEDKNLSTDKREELLNEYYALEEVSKELEE